MQRQLFYLATSLAVTELVIMLLLSQLTLPLPNIWLHTLLDACGTSLVAIATTYLLQKYRLLPISVKISPIATLKTGTIVFTVEAILMLMLALADADTDSWPVMLLDALSLSIIASLLIERVVIRPHSSTAPNLHSPILSSGLPGYLAGILLLGLGLSLSYQQQLTRQQASNEQHDTQELQLLKSIILSELQHCALDVLNLASQQDLIDFLNNDGVNKKALEQNYIQLLAVKKNYYQVRFIDLAGNERLRVNQAQPQPQPQAIATEALQNKSQRYYVKQALRFNHGEIYLSPLDLNIEHGQLEQPYRPVIRLASPVVDHSGNKLGLLVINLNAQTLLDKVIEAASRSVGELMLIDQSGYWLYSSQPQQQWGFSLPDRQQQRLNLQKPELWQQIQHNNLVQQDAGNYVVQAINPVSDSLFRPTTAIQDSNSRPWPVWWLISYQPKDLANAELQTLRYILGSVFLLITVLGAIGTLMFSQAVNHQRQADLRLLQQAHYDDLTGLPNRRLFMAQLALEMAHSRRSGQLLALLYMDLNKFKLVNDSYGHDIGDELLQQVSQRLRSCFRDSDTLARLGGDELAAVLPNLQQTADLEPLLQRVLAQFNREFQVQNTALEVGISIGIAIFSGQQQEHRDNLIHRADQAMYRAKQQGGNHYQFCQEEANHYEV